MYRGHQTANPVSNQNWKTGVSYSAGDIVTFQNKFYVCNTSHTSGTFITDFNATKWQLMNSTITNYVANSSAETSVDGWSMYADSAASTPVDGTGGSPSSTFTRTTSSPLRGIASFLLTKSANNRMGEGVSYDFSVDAADKTRMMNISFEYAIASGSYFDGDVSVFLYDITNSTLIAPKTSIIRNHSLPSAKFSSDVQLSATGTSYRLIIHIASPSAAAYSLKFDDFNISAKTNLGYGTIITDWQSYTPTLSAGFGSPSNVSFLYRRIGDTLEVKGTFTTGATAALGTISLPNGVSINSSKLPINNTTANPGGKIGDWRGDGYASHSGDITTATATDTTVVYISGPFVSADMLTPVNVNSYIAGEVLSVNFSVPILGWASSTQIVSEYDGRVVAARYHATAANTTGGANVQINFDTKDYDTHGAVVTGVGSWKFTAPVTGIYNIALRCFFGGVAYDIMLWKNGSSYAEIIYHQTNVPSGGSTDIYLMSGEYIDIRAGAALNMVSNPSSIGDANHISISLKSGAQQILAEESSYAPMLSNWVSYTPTFVGFGTVGDVHAEYRRVGDSMEIRAIWQNGTCTSTIASISLPLPYSIDADKLGGSYTSSQSGVPVGNAAMSGGSGDVLGGTVVSCSATSTTVLYFAQRDNDTTGSIKPNNGDQYGNSVYQGFTATVPIKGWNSSTAIISDNDGRVCAAILQGNPASASANAPIIFPTVTYDSHNAYSTSTGLFTVPISGVYKLSGGINSTAPGGSRIQIYKNGSLYSSVGTNNSNGGGGYSGSVNANAGETLAITCTSSLDCDGDSSLNIELLAGSQKIAAGSNISAKYYVPSNLAVSANDYINYSTNVFDLTNSVTTGTGTSWRFTAPANGKYRVSVIANLTSSVTNIVLVKNGSDVEYITQPNTGIAAASTTIDLLVGDWIALKSEGAVTYQGVSSSKPLNTISIEMIGSFLLDTTSNPNAPVASISPSAATTTTISGLNGNVDKQWKIRIKGTWTGGDGIYISIRPNSDSGTNYRGVLYFEYDNGGTLGYATATNMGYIIRKGYAGLNTIDCELDLACDVSNGVRTYKGNTGWYSVQPSGGYQYVGGGWNNSTDNITSMYFDFGSGGAFTGTINIYKDRV